MKSLAKIDSEIDEIIYASEKGAGFGGGAEQEKELDRRISALQHRKTIIIEKRNLWLTFANLAIAILNIGLLAYQIFFIGN